MEAARREMGADAVLRPLTSRPTTGESRALGGYEVVCAIGLPEAGNTRQPAKISTANNPDARPGNQAVTGSEGNAMPHASGRAGSGLPGGLTASSKTTLDAILTEMQDMRRQLRSSQQANWRMSDQPRWIATSPQLRNLYGQLMDSELDPDLAQQLLGAAFKEQGDSLGSDASPHHATGAAEPPASSLLTALARQIQTNVRLDSGLGEPSTGAKVVALIGPPGAGKTATIAKLAVQFGLPSRKPTVLLSSTPFGSAHRSNSAHMRTSSVCVSRLSRPPGRSIRHWRSIAARDWC